MLKFVQIFIIVLAVFLLILPTIAAEPMLPGYPDPFILWFPLVFNEAEHPEMPAPTPLPTPTPVPTLVPGCLGYSHAPGYDGPPEYPKRVEPNQTYQACFAHPGCRLGALAQNQLWFYHKHLSRVTLAGHQTIILSDFRYNNANGYSYLVLVKEPLPGLWPIVGRKIMDLEPILYPGGTYIVTLQHDIEPGEANGIGIVRGEHPIMGEARLIAWVAFHGPCP